MTKADIVDIVAHKIGMTKKESTDLVEQVIETLKSTLENGENIKISGFGNFIVRQKADRRGRNPQTGEAIAIDARKVLTFKPSVILKKEII
jgi:integration host factor subunit alpha